MAILSYFGKYFSYFMPEFKSYRIDSTYANGNLLYSKGNFVGDIYMGSGDKIYSNGDYYGDHYVSCIALDDYGLTILNSGGITIYSSAYQDVGEAVFGEITQSDGTKKRVLYADKDKTEVIEPVFYADEKGNLVLKGIVYADGGEFNGTIYASAGEFTGKITASEGGIAGFTISSNSLYNGKSAYNDNQPGVYLGTNGIGLGKITENEDTGFYVTADGEIVANSIELNGSGTLDTCIVEGLLNCNSASVYFNSVTFQNGVTVSNKTFTNTDSTGTVYGLSIGMKKLPIKTVDYILLQYILGIKMKTEEYMNQPCCKTRL